MLDDELCAAIWNDFGGYIFWLKSRKYIKAIAVLRNYFHNFVEMVNCQNDVYQMWNRIYNPKDMIIDSKVRDIAEYFKDCFFYKSDNKTWQLRFFYCIIGVEKIKNDKDIAAKFKKDPITTVEGLIGIDLPNDQIEKIVEGIKAKLALDKIDMDKVGSVLGGLFGKK